MDIFDSMIGNQQLAEQEEHDLVDQSSVIMAGNFATLSQQQQQPQRHFPVLKIVEPGDPEAVSPSLVAAGI